MNSYKQAILVQLAWFSLVGLPNALANGPDFDRDIAPILKRACWKCHGEQPRKAKLDLRTPQQIRSGGKSGPAIADNSATKSLLYQHLSSGKMPPPGEPRVSLDEIQTVRLWLEAGASESSYEKEESTQRPLVTAKDRDYYAFRQLTRPSLPEVQSPQRTRTAIDRFVLHRLDKNNLSYAPDADRLTLVRRAYLDLCGLPPTLTEIDKFLTDPAPNAYERLIDRLLAAPGFGERWGRHWLDAAGYVDVYGSDENAPSIRLPPGGWKYRDYVVQSINRDKPYDRFLIEQVAGDELVDWRKAPQFTAEIKELLIATGFLRTAIDDTDQGVLNILSNRYSVIFDQMEIFGSCVLGLTLQCARCHSHKYDPIPSRDYFQLMANFTPAFNPHTWVKLNERKVPDVGPVQQQQIDTHNAECDAKIKTFQDQIEAVKNAGLERILNAKLPSLPEEIREAVRSAVQTPADKRSDEQKKLAMRLKPISPEEITAELTDQEREKVANCQAEISRLNGTRKGYGWIFALFDTGPPPETRQLIRGEYLRPGKPVQNGFLSVLNAPGTSTSASPSEVAGETSGRRLSVAHWLTTPDTPASGLVARVMVNRLWHHLLGRGIVATPGNLGRSGEQPTHPQLLDWLASEAISQGWSQKFLIRKTMVSTVYRQASAKIQPAESADPENHLLWKMRLKRLEGEVIRDAVLMASGKLDRTPGGPPVPLEVLPNGRTIIARSNLPTPTSQWRRSLYLTSRRNYHVSMLGVFDIPVITTNCTSRNQSTVVLQSLTMLNDEFILDQADNVAQRVTHEAGEDQQLRIQRAFEFTLARPPADEESQWSQEFLDQQTANYTQAKEPAAASSQKALAALCQMLLNTNDFLYVE